MQFSREEKEAMGFPWGGLLAVTGICAILFSIFLQQMDGEHPPLLIKAGVVLLGVSLIRSVFRGLLSKRNIY